MVSRYFAWNSDSQNHRCEFDIVSIYFASKFDSQKHWCEFGIVSTYFASKSDSQNHWCEFGIVDIKIWLPKTLTSNLFSMGIPCIFSVRKCLHSLRSLRHLIRSKNFNQYLWNLVKIRVGNFHLEVQVPWYYCLEPRVTSTQGLEVCFQLFSSQGLESLEPFNFFQVKALITFNSSTFFKSRPWKPWTRTFNPKNLEKTWSWFLVQFISFISWMHTYSIKLILQD